VRKEEEAAKEQIKGGSYIRLVGPLKDEFKALSKELGFDPENPRADKAIKKVGTMVAAMGIELARACLASGTENLAEYVAKVKAGAVAEPVAEPTEGDEEEAEDEPSDDPKVAAKA